ncbi:MAG: hypothetical protein AAB411_00905 [Patescibacteria group bacterium]
MKWQPPEDWVCPHCGTPNPDRGSRCGNCDENPFIIPTDELIGVERLKTLQAVIRRKNKK